MAIGFGSTDGAGTTDQWLSALTSHATQRTYAGWIWRNGTGGGGYGRILDKQQSGTGSNEILYYASSRSSITYWRQWSSGGEWHLATDPGTGAWYHLAVRYDSGSTSNDPSMWVDGASSAVTRDTAPSGSVVSSATSWCVGNRDADHARVWDGRLAEWGIWDTLLSDAQVIALAQGATPLHYRVNLVEYLPLLRTPLSPMRAHPTATGTAVQPHPPKVFAVPSRRAWAVPAAVTPPTTDALFGHLGLLGVGR